MKLFLRSAAWDVFQIMGFNHILCGYDLE